MQPQSGYFKFIWGYSHCISTMRRLPWKLIKPFIRTIDEDHYRHILWRYHKYYLLYLLLISIFYDILFNGCILKGFYYILPFAFIYHILLILDEYLELFLDHLACPISCFFYLDVKHFTAEEITFTNDYTCKRHHIAEAFTFIANGFSPINKDD